MGEGEYSHTCRSQSTVSAHILPCLRHNLLSFSTEYCHIRCPTFFSGLSPLCFSSHGRSAGMKESLPNFTFLWSTLVTLESLLDLQFQRVPNGEETWSQRASSWSWKNGSSATTMKQKEWTRRGYNLPEPIPLLCFLLTGPMTSHPWGTKYSDTCAYRSHFSRKPSQDPHSVLTPAGQALHQATSPAH